MVSVIRSSLSMPFASGLLADEVKGLGPGKLITLTSSVPPEIMRIALVHTLFEEAGGGERLALEMYRALKDLGHEVGLYTAHVDDRAWEVLTSGMNGIPRPEVLGEPLTSRLLRRSGRLVRYRRLLTMGYLARYAEGLRQRYDVIVETQSNVPLRWADASYIHFPALIDYMALQARAGGLRRLYDWLIVRRARSLADSTRPVMTNSSWTFEYVRKAYGSQRIYVVYPPVNVEELLLLGGDRGKVVLTVSRISPEKRLTAIAEVARLVPEAEFYLVGSTSVYSGPVLREIRERAEGLSNFHLETDVPRRRILELMSQASIYLHPPFAEHFGIAIAEAAAAGLVPVVYRDGGGWTDIASRVDQGLGYANAEEAASIIRSLMSDKGRLEELSARAREVAKGFSYDAFKGRLEEVIKALKG
ncbi:glycosyltransferase family 4 protein [Acidilobus sp. 7A]|uniref:glycosyltransferase family 4 protein n=1 Tax=Acidilobus sp. 7A TaxID=1577685 RepID=UPI001314D343|nr:glycosyltransferase family 4 protein [Acidilobus sp. 7A]